MIFKATLVHRKQITANILELDFFVEGDDYLAFSPGQYVMVEVGDVRRRPYSIMHADDFGKKFSLLVDTAPQGKGSLFLESLSEGSDVMMQGPFGIMTLDRSDKYLFFATGVGIAPFMPMFEQLFRNGFSGSVRFVQGAHDDSELLLKDRFVSQQQIASNFHYIPLVHERIETWIEHNYMPDPDELVYVCGGSQMVRACRTALQQKSTDPKQLKIEVFS